MSVIFFLIAIGVLVAGGFLAAFIWSVRNGQYDDDYAPSVRILFDDFKPEAGEPAVDQSGSPEKTSESQSNQSNNNKN